MINYYLEQEQEQRLAQALDERNQQADRNCDLAAKGEFDGLIGTNPDQKLLAEPWYWQGYQSGLKEYWLKHYDIEIEQEF